MLVVKVLGYVQQNLCFEPNYNSILMKYLYDEADCFEGNFIVRIIRSKEHVCIVGAYLGKAFHLIYGTYMPVLQVRNA